MLVRVCVCVCVCVCEREREREREERTCMETRGSCQASHGEEGAREPSAM
jgi:hypothetical protein